MIREINIKYGCSDTVPLGVNFYLGIKIQYLRCVKTDEAHMISDFNLILCSNYTAAVSAKNLNMTHIPLNKFIT